MLVSSIQWTSVLSFLVSLHLSATPAWPVAADKISLFPDTPLQADSTCAHLLPNKEVIEPPAFEVLGQFSLSAPAAHRADVSVKMKFGGTTYELLVSNQRAGHANEPNQPPSQGGTILRLFDRSGVKIVQAELPFVFEFFRNTRNVDRRKKQWRPRLNLQIPRFIQVTKFEGRQSLIIVGRPTEPIHDGPATLKAYVVPLDSLHSFEKYDLPDPQSVSEQLPRDVLAEMGVSHWRKLPRVDLVTVVNNKIMALVLRSLEPHDQFAVEVLNTPAVQKFIHPRLTARYRLAEQTNSVLKFTDNLLHRNSTERSVLLDLSTLQLRDGTGRLLP